MAWEAIHKSSGLTGLAPNLPDYGAVRRGFSWADAEKAMDGLPGGGLNIAYEAVDRHILHGRSEQLAIRWLGGSHQRDATYLELAALTNKFANVLRSLGVGKGDRIFCLSGRVPALYIAALGTFKNGSVFSPLFSAFGPEPVRARMTLGSARVLVTTEALYRKKVEAWRKDLPSLEFVLLTETEGESLPPGTLSLDEAMSRASAAFAIVPTTRDDLALLHFTSGTTGKPKGAMHVHGAVVSHALTGRLALDIHPEDRVWCTADPGWVTGMSYGVISPLVNGATLIVDEAEFDAESWYRTLQEQMITVWYTAPTAIRMMMKLGADIVRKYDLSRLRFMASVGEPLNPEAVVWSQETFGKPFHDNWWQTETGGIMIANYATMDVKPGSMGKPMPGIEAGIVARTADGGVAEVTAPMVPGELALRPGWPSMFRGYLNEDERYRKCFVGGWYLSGDLAMRDADGYFWFVGRGDDVIKSSGHLIGPFEVESALMEHPAVAEAGVIGKPDPVAGEVVKAFVALKPGFEPGDALRKDLLGHARKRLGPAIAPKEIDFRVNLPKTRSGKIMRRLLKARELGLPEGDLSTLESDER
jgi:acetyl-CoA synthetase